MATVQLSSYGQKTNFDKKTDNENKFIHADGVHDYLKFDIAFFPDLTDEFMKGATLIQDLGINDNLYIL